MDVQLIENIASTRKRKKKEDLLKTADEETQRFLQWALDPTKMFGVTVSAGDAVHSPCDGWWGKLDNILQKLTDRELTGNEALKAVNNHLAEAPTELDLKWAVRIINKDLRAGIAAATVNKVFPGLITSFDVALAEPFDPDKCLPLQGKWVVEPKLDGLRMIVLGGKAWTRNGKEITSVGPILEELSKYLDLDECVLDGEVMGASDDFDEASGSIRQKEKNTDLTYNVFDLVLREHWDKQETATLLDRKAVMESLLGEANGTVCIVPWVEVDADSTFDDLEKLRDVFIEEGYEGAMLKADAPYRFKRSRELLKLKKFETLDAEVVGVYEGKGDILGSLGGIVVEHEGKTTKCGSGFTHKQRAEIWADPDSVIGRVAEIKYQNLTKTGSMRFPIFVKFRFDKE